MPLKNSKIKYFVPWAKDFLGNPHEFICKAKVLQKEILLPRGHIAMFKDIFGCHN